MTTAIVNGNGKPLSDGRERLYLHVNKKVGGEVGWCVGRVPIVLVIGGTEYRGELCARSDYPYIYVGSRLCDAQAVSHQLTHILLANGFCKKDRACISVDGNRLTVSRVRDVE